jgi:hypothetical protein
LPKALRHVFYLLETSVGEFAADCHRDKGAVSRYLGGKRVPPRKFVDDLLNAALEARGETVVTTVVGDNLRELHLRAFGAHDPQGAKLQALEDDLSLYANRKKDLEAELAQRKHEVGRLAHQVWKPGRAAERKTGQLIRDLERRLKEATAERRKAEQRLLMEQVVASTGSSTAEQNIGILGCVM